MLNVSFLSSQESRAFRKGDNPLATAYERGRFLKSVLLQDALSAAEAAKNLGVDSQELEQWRKSQKLLGISTDSHEFIYPQEQFYKGKLLNGLDQVLVELTNLSPIAQLSFLTTGDIRLEGKTPIECLQADQIEQVVWAAGCYGHQGAA